MPLREVQSRSKSAASSSAGIIHGRSSAPKDSMIDLLENAPEPGGHAADVVRVAGCIGPHPFAAAPRKADFQDRLAAEAERAADADAGLQPIKVQLVGM